jgi:hypothetical protein
MIEWEEMIFGEGVVDPLAKQRCWSQFGVAPKQ